MAELELGKTAQLYRDCDDDDSGVNLKDGEGLAARASHFVYELNAFLTSTEAKDHYSTYCNWAANNGAEIVKEFAK